MGARLANRATPLAVGGVLLLTAAGIAAVALQKAAGDQEKLFVFAVIGLVVAVAVLAAPVLDPAWPLSLGLALSVFSGNWQNLGVPQGVDRPLLLLGLLGTVLRMLPDARERRLPQLRPVHWLLALLSIYAIGSALFAGTLLSRESLFALVDKLGIIPFGLFLLAPIAFATERQRQLLLFLLVVLGAYLGITALLETTGPKALVFPRYITDPAIGLHADRARGPFAEAAANGLALFVCAVAAAMAFAQWRGRWRQAAAVVVVLCGAGIVFTLTRQVWLGGVAGALVTLFVARELRRYLIPTVVLCAAGVLLALAFVPGLRTKATSRAESQRPVWDRLNSDDAALRMIEAKPLLGFGWYRWQQDSQPYYRLAPDYPLTTVNRPHNVFLGTAVELGLVGFLAWFGAVVLGIGGAIVRRGPPELRVWRFGLIAIVVDWLVVANFTPLGYAFPNYVIWMWAGIVAGGAVRAPSLGRSVAPTPAAPWPPPSSRPGQPAAAR